MWNDLRFRLRALFRRNAEETELNDELRFHFEQQVESTSWQASQRKRRGAGRGFRLAATSR